MKSLRELVTNLQVECGVGTNRFTMSRGSFNYRQFYIGMRPFKLESRYPEKDCDCYVFRDRFGYMFLMRVRKDGHFIRISYECSDPRVNRFRFTIPSHKDEKIYGCGETYSKFNLKGERVRIFVAEHQNTSRITRKLVREMVAGEQPFRQSPFRIYESYYAQPTFVSDDCYFVHCDTTRYAEFDFRREDTITFNLQEPAEIVFSRGTDFTQLSERLSELLGRQKELPDWIYDGAILAIQGGTDVVQQKIDTALNAGIRLTGVWSQDWCGCRRTGFGYQVMWNWEYDQELYHDLKDKIKEWNAKGIHFLGYINPFMAIEKRLYQYAHEKGYCVKDKNGEDYLVTITTFPAAMIDFTNPEAYDWYKSLIKENMIGIGLSGWMADFGEYLPVDCVLYDGSDPEKVHNTWPAIWAKMNREALEECGVRDKVFFFTRAGFTGTVKESTMMWTGDQHVDWSLDDGLISVVPATLSLAMSGYGITHSDAGGYTTVMNMRRTKELLMRWTEMNAFTPLLRTHEGNQPVNDVQFDADEELLAHMAKFSRVHAALKPYLQKLVKETEEKGTPVMRPLFYHYNEEQAKEEMSEYLLGRDILVAPVYIKEARVRNVYLPDDRWISFRTGIEYHGGTYSIPAPIGKPPVFYRKDHTQLTDELIKTIREELNHE